MDTLVQVSNVTKTYDNDGAPAVAHVSMEVSPGESVAVMGPSGSGKSTLLNLIAGLDRPTGGEIRVGGERIDTLSETGLARFRRRQVGMIFQFFNLLDDMTVLDNVLLPAQLAGMPTPSRRGPGPMSCWPRCGSGSTGTPTRPGCPAGNGSGWRSRGRWSTGPRCCWPTSRPGPWTPRPGRRSASCCSTSNSSGQTLILVTHNPDLAARYAARVIEIVDGRVASDAATGARR